MHFIYPKVGPLAGMIHAAFAQKGWVAFGWYSFPSGPGGSLDAWLWDKYRQQRARSPTSQEEIILTLHRGYQLISCTGCKWLISGGSLLFNGQILMPEHLFDSHSTNTGGFGIRETSFIPPLQRIWDTLNATSIIIWNWFCHFLWHPFLWINLNFGLSVDHLAEIRFLHENGRYY